MTEICLTFYCSRSYRWSFFFFLDVLSTLSLLLDIGWISDIAGLSGSTADSTASAAQLARAAKASRIGTRAGRIVRIIRLVRLIRIVKIYKASQIAKEKRELKQLKQRQNKKKDKENQEEVWEGGANIDSEEAPQFRGEYCPKEDLDSPQKAQTAYVDEEDDDDEEKELIKETRVGKKLSDLTTKRVIALVLSIMISIPLFSVSTYITQYTSYDSGAQNLHL